MEYALWVDLVSLEDVRITNVLILVLMEYALWAEAVVCVEHKAVGS